MLRFLIVIPFLAAIATAQEMPPSADVIDLDPVVAANERGILCLAEGKDGRIYMGTTGRAANLVEMTPTTGKLRLLNRLEGGIGFSYAMIALPDGSLIVGTQADPTKTARATDAKQVGRLLRIYPDAPGENTKDLGIPVPGQGIYTLAYLPQSEQIVGNTWPEGHFFVHDLKTKETKDLGPIAGHRTFETPRHAEDLNRHGKDNIFYPRQVSRAIAIDPVFGAITAGANGVLHRYDPAVGKLEKLKVQLPSVPGREPWASLDAAVVLPAKKTDEGSFITILGGTSDGHLFELRWTDAKNIQMRPKGRALAQGTIQGLTPLPHDGPGQSFFGIGGPYWSLPRTFTMNLGGKTSSLVPGGIPHGDGQPSMVGIGALMTAKDGTIYAGEQDRIARLLHYRPGQKTEKPKPAPPKKVAIVEPEPEKLKALNGWVVFAPGDTTTDGSGYTAITVGSDGKVYIGAARYGGSAWLLRFDPKTKTHFMEKVVSAAQLTGEELDGINAQGKIHAIIIVGPDGRIWFATKQAHEIFGTRPEFGEDPLGYPGGHLCYYDPKTGFSRSMGILKKQEGLMAGVIDKKRNILYYRSEPRNYFLAYEVETGKVRDLGHIGANCRYMAIDQAGVIYQPGRGDILARYDPAIGYVEDLKVKLEGEGTYVAPYVIQMGPNGKLYGLGISHPWVMEFDIDRIKPGRFGEVVVRNVARATPPGIPTLDIHAAIFGKDQKLYYTVQTQGPNLEGKKDRHTRIMRFDPKSKQTETVGVPVLSFDEAAVKSSWNRGDKYLFDSIQGMVVSDDGTLFVMDIYPQLNVAVFPKLTAPK